MGLEKKLSKELNYNELELRLREAPKQEKELTQLTHGELEYKLKEILKEDKTDAKYISALKVILGDKREEYKFVHNEAAEVLRRVGPDGIPLMIENPEDMNGWLKEDICYAIRTIYKNRKQNHIEEKPVLDFLKLCLSDKNEHVKYGAMYAIMKMRKVILKKETTAYKSSFEEVLLEIEKNSKINVIIRGRASDVLFSLECKTQEELNKMEYK